MNLLITGASGFIGKNFILNCPPHWNVVALFNNSNEFTTWIKDKELSNINPLKINLLNIQDIELLSSKTQYFDACLYLAANGDPAWSAQHPADDLRQNAEMLVNLLEKVSFGKFIYFSSGAVYDGLQGFVNPTIRVNPVLPYAISKYAAERYIAYFKKIGKIQQPSVVRFFGAYGEYEAPRKIYGKLIKQFAIDKNPLYALRGDGKNKIDAMYIKDTIRAIHLLLNDSNPPENFDLGSGSPMTITELITVAASVFGINPVIQYSGDVPEYIEFTTNDTTFQEKYKFSPLWDIKTGLTDFYNQIGRKNSDKT